MKLNPYQAPSSECLTAEMRERIANKNHKTFLKTLGTLALAVSAASFGLKAPIPTAFGDISEIVDSIGNSISPLYLGALNVTLGCYAIICFSFLAWTDRAERRLDTNCNT